MIITTVDPKPKEVVVPKLYYHCLNAYRAMFKDSTRDPDTEHVLWEGFVTKFYVNDLNLSTPYVSWCNNAMLSMGCIKQISRGGGQAKSVYELIKEPTEDDFMLYVSDDEKAPTKKPNERVKQRYDHIVDTLDEALVKIASLEKRVQTLEDNLVVVIKKVKELTA